MRMIGYTIHEDECSPRQSFGCDAEQEMTSYVPFSHGMLHAVTLYIYTESSASLARPPAVVMTAASASDVSAPINAHLEL